MEEEEWRCPKCNGEIVDIKKTKVFLYNSEYVDCLIGKCKECGFVDRWVSP